MPPVLKPHLEFEFCPASEAYGAPPRGPGPCSHHRCRPAPSPRSSPSRVFRPPGPRRLQASLILGKILYDWH